MGRVSRRIINPEVEERVFEIFRNYLAHLRNPLDIQEFLLSLLSYTEQVMIAKRLAIALLISRGFTYEHIDQTLKVSKSTIGTVHKQLLIGATGYKKAVSHIFNKEQRENIFNTLEEIILRLSPPKAFGSAAWETKSKKGKALAKRKRQLSSL